MVAGAHIHTECIILIQFFSLFQRKIETRDTLPSRRAPGPRSSFFLPHIPRTPNTMAKTPAIFLYRLMTDAGSAPNVDGGMCTLALCKPKIRSTAKVGDYIIGLRARSGELGALGPHAEDSVLYVMRVTRKYTMSEYDAYCTAHASIKIPGPDNDYRGDCQYKADGTQRDGPHSPAFIEKDLGGKYVLVGDGACVNFWYRRSPAGVRLPAELAGALAVADVKRGHRRLPQTPDTVAPLVEWLAGGVASGEFV